MRLDTVLHEIGHSFFHTIFHAHKNSCKVQASFPTSLDEMFADVIASVYDNSPCRTRIRDGSCSRNLDQHARLLHKHLWEENIAHHRNAP